MSTAPPNIAIVVPALNEAENVPALAQQFAHLTADGAQWVLVDGGSTDNTAEMAAAAGMTVLQSPRGRAKQLNAGAQHALQHYGADIVLFLHADTHLPPSALPALRQYFQAHHSNTAMWGRFDVRIEGQFRMLRVIAWLMNWRSRITGIATGDQALFMTRAAFEKVGGFPDQPLMEDIEICKRLRALSAPICIRTPVITAGRRWEKHGLWRTVFLMWHLRWLYWRGVPASQLAKRYRPHTADS